MPRRTYETIANDPAYQAARFNVTDAEWRFHSAVEGTEEYAARERAMHAASSGMACVIDYIIATTLADRAAERAVRHE